MIVTQLYVQHSNRGAHVFSRSAAPMVPPKSFVEDFTDAAVTGKK